MPYTPKDAFKSLTEEIKSTGQSRKLTVRELLSYFHQQRRSDPVVRWIHDNLEKFGIECIPDFEQVFIDSTVELRKKPTIKDQSAEIIGRDGIENYPRPNSTPCSATRCKS